eukprot:jgi/Psemu1/27770/gm1.27770_g
MNSETDATGAGFLGIHFTVLKIPDDFYSFKINNFICQQEQQIHFDFPTIDNDVNPQLSFHFEASSSNNKPALIAGCKYNNNGNTNDKTNDEEGDDDEDDDKDDKDDIITSIIDDHR